MIDILLSVCSGTHNSSFPVAIGLVGCLLIAIICRSWTNPLSAIPGPWLSNWTGVVTTYHWFMGRRAQYVDSLHNKYGPIVRVSPTEVHVNDIPAVKEIHKVGSRYLKSDWYFDLTTRSTVTIFNTTSPSYHSHLRKLMSGPISDANLKQYEPIIMERVSLALEGIDDEIRARGAADIFKWATFLATDVIGELTFGESFKMLERREKNQYVEDLETIASNQPFKTTFPWLVTAGLYIQLGVFRRIAELIQRLQEYATQSVQRYQDHLKQNPTNPKPTLFTKLYNAEEQDILNHKEILANAQSYIVAGSDTTALTLTYLIYAVCKDWKIKDRLVKELASLPPDFRDTDCRELPFLNQVITETLRAYPVIATALPRIVPSGGAVLAGYSIPGGMTVSTQAYSLHNNPVVFPAPQTFDPSRWETPTKEMNDSFMAFGGGSRVCIGMHLAKVELRLATAHFFRRFSSARVSSKEGMSDADMEMKAWFLAQPKGHRCLIEA
ncbi:putative benzoate 4-monooxygenase cytochrome P450 [Talaromyces proteolyticus]|uniref:Benzoate 4-monooxygenase cytochrome P450 n=1 Tax=Talaromyces proteolyticus TaxID=1131652 RepID=A0AAD4PWS3_9EURO|nr:putative benzoate 4-monooxygenase cytochrome P450 [Talaromyces proteolyticus]KAH8691949.1 putative benzoate 4-monooxygenase cytochrome P450 [Talaromyces proteolyticus]